MVSAQPTIELQDARRLQVYALIRGGWDRIAASDHAYCLFWMDDPRTKDVEAALWQALDFYVAGTSNLHGVRDAFQRWEAKLIEIDEEMFGGKVVAAKETSVQMRLVT